MCVLLFFWYSRGVLRERRRIWKNKHFAWYCHQKSRFRTLRNLLFSVVLCCCFFLIFVVFVNAFLRFLLFFSCILLCVFFDIFLLLIFQELKINKNQTEFSTKNGQQTLPTTKYTQMIKKWSPNDQKWSQMIPKWFPNCPVEVRSMSLVPL